MKKKKNLTWLWSLIILIIILGFLIGAFLIFKVQILNLITGLNNSNNNSGSGDSNSNIYYSCTDSDEGLSYYMVGHTTDQDNIRYYDKCEDDSRLTEYYCSNNRVTTRDFTCPSEYKCLQTRSGGYCESLPTGYNGQEVGSGSGSGAITGGFLPAEIIDMSSLNLEYGNCGLKMLINTQWNYANPSCQGIQGNEGLIWQVYDSNGLYWTRTDTNPLALGTELNCGMSYDGQTDWRIMVGKTLNIPNCNINYEYDYKIILCNCQ